MQPLATTSTKLQLRVMSYFSDDAPGTGSLTPFNSSWSTAELGRHAGLIHVETPNRGKIQACRANQATMKPMAKRISMFEDPCFYVVMVSWQPDSEAAAHRRPSWPPGKQHRWDIGWRADTSCNRPRCRPGSPCSPRKRPRSDTLCRRDWPLPPADRPGTWHQRPQLIDTLCSWPPSRPGKPCSPRK